VLIRGLEIVGGGLVLLLGLYLLARSAGLAGAAGRLARVTPAAAAAGELVPGG